MKVGIYIPGLGQSVANQSMLLYAQRFMRELDFSDPVPEVSYSLKAEKVDYGEKNEAEVITILRNGEGEETPVYRLYEFTYSSELVEKFNNHNVLMRSFLLLMAVASKLPAGLFRLFRRRNYDWAGQAFYMFILFTVISFFVVILLPMALALVTGYLGDTSDPAEEKYKLVLTKVSEWLISVSAAISVLIPGFNLLITALATEFVCVHYYLDMGQQAQRVQGKLSELVEFVATHDKAAREIHFHTYSFGSIIALDYLFPFVGKPNERARRLTKGIFMVGSPYEFIHAYYPRYFEGRQVHLADGLHWVNVYSLADSMASNFRTDHSAGDAEVPLPGTQLKPHNIHYEIARPKRGVLAFFMFQSVRAHSSYWDNRPYGASCLQPLVAFMRERGIIEERAVEAV